MSPPQWKTPSVPAGKYTRQRDAKTYEAMEKQLVGQDQTRLDPCVAAGANQTWQGLKIQRMMRSSSSWVYHPANITMCGLHIKRRSDGERYGSLKKILPSEETVIMAKVGLFKGRQPAGWVSRQEGKLWSWFRSQIFAKMVKHWTGVLGEAAYNTFLTQYTSHLYTQHVILNKTY